jgi:hypothetical protein
VATVSAVAIAPIAIDVTSEIGSSNVSGVPVILVVPVVAGIPAVVDIPSVNSVFTGFGTPCCWRPLMS